MKSIDIRVTHPASQIFERDVRRSSIEFGDYESGKVEMANTGHNRATQMRRFIFTYDTKEQREHLLATLAAACEQYKAVPIVYESTLNIVNVQLPVQPIQKDI